MGPISGHLEAFDLSTRIKPGISKLQLPQAISQDGVLETKKQVVKKRKKYRIPTECGTFMKSYNSLDILPQAY